MRKLWFLLCVLGVPCASFAQSSAAAWGNLNAIPVGQKIQVLEMNSTKASGTLVNVSDTAISLQGRSGAQTILAAKLKPDAVLLDFRMPVMNGLDAAKEIIRNNPSIPVAMYTLDQNAQFETQAVKIGVRKIISKTDLFHSLTSSLDEMVGNAQS